MVGIGAQERAMIEQVKARMPQARFMCTYFGCTIQSGSLPQYWYRRDKANAHRVATNHRVIPI